MSVFIVAEIGLNHGGDLRKAEEMILEAQESGVDAVKFQMFDLDDYKDSMIRDCWMGRTELKSLKECADGVGIEWFCTPEKPEHVDFLESINVKRYKISHLKNTDPLLLEAVEKTKKPVIISRLLYQQLPGTYLWKGGEITCLYCTDKYPTPPEELRLPSQLAYGRYQGFSDHTEDITASIVAAARGAKIIEVHVKLDENCVDAAVSKNFIALKNLVQHIRRIEKYDRSR